MSHAIPLPPFYVPGPLGVSAPQDSAPRRQTPAYYLDEMAASCTAKDFIRLKTTFDKWTHEQLDIHTLHTVMHQAVAEDFAEVVALFLSHGQPVYSTYVLSSVENRAKGSIREFIKGGWNINEPTGQQQTTILGFALKDEDFTLWLLDQGADPNQQCLIDLTPMSFAVKNASLSTLRLLFDRGADVQKGQLLHHAVSRPLDDIITVLGILLDKGAPINAKKYENHPVSWGLYFFMGLGTALHQAAEEGKADVVKYLIQRGADMTIRDARNRTALDCALAFNHEDVVAVLEPAIE
ncbi:putative hspc200 [Aspergillus californicus]